MQKNNKNWNDIKNIIKKELNETSIKESTTVSAGNTKFNLRTGVNKNPTKLGIKLQFEPKGGMLEPDTKAKLEVALQTKLNESLKEFNIQVSKDTDVPRSDVIGFFIPLKQIKNLVVKSLTGEKVEEASVAAPEPEGEESWEDKDGNPSTTSGMEDKEIEEMISHEMINEMRVRDLNEISKVVIKEDFYAFINAGNNVLRSLEESGRSVSEAKKYLAYLVKHNIM